ncbi:hypothetical protein CLAFUW4_02650 [Fulvia fulva]|uniref:Uncharacterized protein n=1 Tax=Passalora fulva TaxID=5499 RepID=A0A9Q8LA46_PASFU|nr:uncharacterized protein CLAFUR5_02640 [Fulvia fulva]KAK4632168.1 hypothetical protein CLAFUR4_02645 [Fulvia fulva]KAK4632977.1 hypothetical protein CLAFUR0_02647 [Fulvia fulva]UJO13642.1 hypothetical protein CLAFUR5_02640 [Fulvia fulva]WPV11574.1 hypothetical protein CLAFUW4_02650 [Fulvia fulva]WPV26286.1 hypothetical protein CLAFUW7_02650 [Fulvia fulva]
MTTPGASCPFLELPCELRLLIYGYAVLDSPTITIGTAQLTGTHADIVHRFYGSSQSPFPGIPQNHEPVVETRYQSALLSNQATIQLSPATTEPLNEPYQNTQTAYHILSRLCKQVNHELKSHFSIPSRRQTSLFVQYPHGLHVFHKVTPQLLRQARSVHLAGVYIPSNFSPARAACLGPRNAPAQEKLQGTTPNSAEELGDLIKSMFGPDAQHPIEKLEMRVYFPGEDSYGTVWGDDSSPIVVALRNISLGEISMEVWRGRHATGVYLTATPAKERKRVVSTVWRKLEEGGRGEPARGSWIVDPKWPEWAEEYSMSPGSKGDTIISVPA